MNTMHIFNKKDLEFRRKGLRQQMPQPENILWSKLRAKQLNDYKFRRQYGVGNYILDFYCPSVRLAIEIDGDSHFQPRARINDCLRENYLAQFNIKVLRFSNKEIMSNLGEVLNKIGKTVSNTPSSSS